MPNQCSNRVIIEGNKLAIAKIASMFIVDKDRHQEGTCDLRFDLNRFLPVPEQLKNVTLVGMTPGHNYVKGTKTIVEMTLDGYKDTRGKTYDYDEVEFCEFTARKIKELEDAYGASNWYDWQVKNYGCKWGFYPCERLDITETTIDFNAATPWNPASEALCKLSEIYKVTVTNHFYEFADDLLGTIVHTNGNSEETYNYFKELHQFKALNKSNEDNIPESNSHEESNKDIDLHEESNEEIEEIRSKASEFVRKHRL